MSNKSPFYRRQAPRLDNDPADWVSGFESEREAADRHKARDNLMFNRNPAARPNFHWCSQSEPCNSAACSLCMREFRRWWADAGATFLEQQSGRLSAASLIHHTLARCPATLHSFDIRKAKRQLARHLDRADLGNLVVIGGFDFCYNQPIGGGSAHWQPHAYLIIEGADRKIIKKRISRFYPRRPHIPRPVRTRDVTDLVSTLTYAMKSTFWRRSSYIDPTGRANTRSLPLRLDAERELLSYLDQLLPTDRLFLKNVRRRGEILVRDDS